jgi:hypothetical protein
MSGLSLSVDVVNRVSPAIQAVTRELTDLRGLHNAMGYAARTLTRNHLIELAGSRHDTANRLGAKPSGHWAQAAEDTTFESDANSATVTIAHPGIGRAMHDVTITPGSGKKFLTIPLIAQAYDLRAAAVWAAEELFIAKAKDQSGKDYAVAGKRLSDGSFQAWYLLVPSVHQAQDRSLLPSDTEYERAAVDGAIDYLQFVRRSLS